MDKGLRITVGNDVYYERQRSPSDLRNHLRQKADLDRRRSKERDAFVERNKDLLTSECDRWDRQTSGNQRSSHRSPGHGRHADNFPEKPHVVRGRKGFSPEPTERRYDRKLPRDHVYNPEVHRPSAPIHHRGSPPLSHGRHSRSPYRHQASRTRHRSGSDSSSNRRSSSRGRATRRERGMAKLDDDLLLSIYSRTGDRSDEDRNVGYLHQSLDRIPKRKDEIQNRALYAEKESRAYISPALLKDGHALSVLNEAYGATTPPQKLFFPNNAQDEEEQYLYGDSSIGSTQLSKQEENLYRQRYQSPPRHDSHHRKSPPGHFERARERHNSSLPREISGKDDKGSSVTPGGFDSNALKNVLKAIGFDFELSAQSFQKAATGNIESKESKPVAAVTQDAYHDNRVVHEKSHSRTPPPDPVYQQPVPVHQPAQPAYQIQSLQTAQLINPQVIPPSQTTPGGIYVYQPQALPDGNQLTFQPQVAVSQAVAGFPGQVATDFMSHVQMNRPNLKVIQTDVEQSNENTSPQGSRRNLVPITAAKSLENERRARKKRLDYLEVELEKLKKQQSDLLRKKKRQFNQGDKELMKQNTLLQAGVEKQIQEIRDAAERAAGIRSSSSTSGSDSSSSEDGDAEEYNYIDTGGHFCKECDIAFKTLADFLVHLHTKMHKKLMDPKYMPWCKKKSKRVNKSRHAITVPLKGAHFIMPITGFYCKICEIFSGDQVEADEHCKTRAHNLKYEKHIKRHPIRPQNASDVQNVAEKLKKLKREQDTGACEVSPFHHDRERMQRSREHSPPRLKRPLSRERSPPRVTAPRSLDHSPPRERSYNRERPRSPYRRPHSPSERDVRRVVDKSNKQSTKRRFEERASDVKKIKEEKKRSRQGQWSPGYDEFERAREKEDRREAQRSSKPENQKPTGLGFGKFTWKKNEKRANEEKKPIKTRNYEKGEAEKKNLKTTQAARNKAGLSGRMGTIAPHTTRIKTGMRKEAANSKGRSTLSQRRDTSVTALLATKTVPNVKTRNLRSNKTSPAESKNQNLVELRKTKREPPPPGEEDIFLNEDGGNVSDASGISMEIASDEGL
ncbi:uncharacterized protein LOC143446274 isoform X2 [Clavelina lepadiformis]|uniref:uncharacterized protein LOC143446274 isoform X2 n=1 Tax=Clavelina lepadiformis TaxID=159417 RepID=UPI004041F800